MSKNKILQPLDVNAEIMDRSPARKKARYDSPVKQRWSLTSRSVKLDEVFDYGLSVLDSDSDSEDECRVSPVICERVDNKTDLKFSERDDVCDPKENSSSNDSKTLSCESEQLTPSKSAKIESTSVNLDEWADSLIKKETVNSCEIDYFSKLSDEVILHILHFVPKKQMALVACICSRFHRLTKDESLWARLDVSQRALQPGVLGQILSRQVVILRLAQSEIYEPIILPDCRAADWHFQSRMLYLDLSMVHISTESLAELLSKCKRLKKLSLENVTVDNDVLAKVGNNTELEVMNLAMAEGLQLPGLKALLTNCKKLRELNLAWTFLDSRSINYVCANLPKLLDRFNFSGCRKLLTDSNVYDLVGSCPGLRELDLSDCTGLTGGVIDHIILLQELNFLALSRCYLIPYRSLLSLKSMSSLHCLDVHGGYISYAELRLVQEGLGHHVQINKFKFSSVARPTVGAKRSSIWNLRVRD